MQKGGLGTTALRDGSIDGRVQYAASNVEGETACWKFMEDEKPDFAFNAGKGHPFDVCP